MMDLERVREIVWEELDIEVGGFESDDCDDFAEEIVGLFADGISVDEWIDFFAPYADLEEDRIERFLEEMENLQAEG